MSEWAMQIEQATSDHAAPPPSNTPARRPWIAPRITHMPAGNAQNSIDPIVEDGLIAMGS